MADIILHHYATSPFSEKVRIAFGLKNLAWRSVEIPNVMPKPDLMPLTGGYRKTPVMQVGADVYCDTQIILRELQRRFPALPLPRPATRAWPRRWPRGPTAPCSGRPSAW
jgi:glutathione S-transferase